MKIRIRTRKIGDNEPVFIIAEAGVNHNGDIKQAKKLIDIAVKSKSDAIKFQTFKTENVVTRNAEKAGYQKKTTGSDETQFDMIKKLELTHENFSQLAEYTERKNIIFLSTPFDFESVDILNEIGVPAYKIPSGEITNYPFLKYIAKQKKPIILSTGMASLGEIEQAVNLIKKNEVKEIALLHCVTNYPAKIEELNMRAISTIRSAFKVPVGFSDHSLGIMASIAAVALGACIIEKHITLNKNLPGPDHKASLEPEELNNLVKSIRAVESGLGNGIKKPSRSEEEIKLVARRSIVAQCDIPKNSTITEQMLTLKRPATGLSAHYLPIIIGNKSKTKIDKDEIIILKKIEFV